MRRGRGRRGVRARRYGSPERMKLEEATYGGTSAGGLFSRSKRPVIAIDENHRLVQLTEEIA